MKGEKSLKKTNDYGNRVYGVERNLPMKTISWEGKKTRETNPLGVSL